VETIVASERGRRGQVSAPLAVPERRRDRGPDV